MSTITWVSPNAGLLVTLIELQAGDPVWSTVFTATGGIGVGDIDFMILDGDPPEYYTLTNYPASDTALFEVEPIVRELDEYVDGFQTPPDFTYDREADSNNDATAGGNYATFGSALAGAHTFTFTVRAYATLNDSNGISTIHADRTFSVTILNNWSSDRDRFILEYYTNERPQTLFWDGEEHDPEDFLIEIKGDGYYD